MEVDYRRENSCGLLDLLPKYTDENGKLLSYRRELLSYGNGYDTPGISVADTKEVALKFVYVTMNAKNITYSEKEIMACKYMAYIVKKNGNYYYDNAGYEKGDVKYFQLDALPQYFEECQKGKGYYLADLKAGEDKTFHLGYFIDEDKLEEMMLQFDTGMAAYYGGIKYVDIRQAINK